MAIVDAVRKRPKGQTQELLLNAVGTLISERDTLDVSVSEISKYSGVNQALIKYYFGNKEGLLLALLKRLVGRRMEEVSAVVRMDVTATERLRLHISGLINTYMRYPYMNRLVHELMSNGTPATVEEIKREIVRPLCENFGKIITAGMQRGEFREVDPVLCFFSTVGACDYLFSHRYAVRLFIPGGDINDALRRTLIDHVSSTVIAGIVKPAKA